MSFNFLQHKRKLIISIEEEFINNDAKKKIFEKLKKTRKKEFKDELSQFESFLQFSKKKINNKDFSCKYEELAQFISEQNSNEDDKICSSSILPADSGFFFKYKKKNKPENSIYFFNEPKILGAYFNSKIINVELAFTQKEIFDFNKRIKNYEYYINYLKNGKIFLDKDYNNELLYIVNNKLEKIEIEKLKSENLFPYENEIFDIKILLPLKISQRYFYYFNIKTNLWDSYKYFQSKQRQDLINELLKFIYNSHNNFIGITGPKGIGKTATLIYFSSTKLINAFYINLQNIVKKPKIQTKISLQYEICRLFQSNYNYNNPFIQKIFKEIDSFLDNYNFYDFIIKIIDILNNYIKKENIDSIFCIIIDQYTNQIDTNEIKLFQIKNYLENSENIKCIICSSLNKEIKNYLINTIKKGEDDRTIYDIEFHYFSKLIFENDFKLLLSEKEKFFFNNELKNFQIPYYYYFFQSETSKIELIQNSIIEEIKNYLGENYQIKILECFDIIKTNALLNSERLYLFLEILPMKYINISKIEIAYKDQEWKNSNLKKLFLFYFQNENESLTEKINRYFHLNKIKDKSFLINYQYKEEKIISKSIYDKLKIPLDFNEKEEIKSEKITIYKLDFLFKHMERIFSKMISNYFKSNFKIFKNLLHQEIKGYIFKVCVLNQILEKKKLDNIIIKKFESFYELIPNQFSINYFSYKRSTKIPNKALDFEYYINYFNKKFNIIRKSIPQKITLLLQENFYSKYFDCALLIPNDNYGYFSLILIQISIKKIDRFSKEEIELMSGHTKYLIEKEYDIEISDCYFYYILSSENNVIEDNETFNQFKNQCIGVNIDNNDFKFYQNFNKENIISKSSFITCEFPYHNKCSLFKDFDTISSADLIREITALSETKDFSQIEDNIYELIYKFFKIKNSDKTEVEKLIIRTVGDIKKKSISKYITDFCFIYIEDFKESKIIFKGKEYKICNNNNNIKKMTLYCSLFLLDKK